MGFRKHSSRRHNAILNRRNERGVVGCDGGRHKLLTRLELFRDVLFDVALLLFDYFGKSFFTDSLFLVIFFCLTRPLIVVLSDDL